MAAAVWSPSCRRRRWCKKSSMDDPATSDEDLLSDAGIDVEEDEEGLESVATSSKLCHKLTIPTPRMDTYRFSMANMEDSQDVELDAILGELCALEDKLDREMMPKSQSANQALSNAWTRQPSNPPNQNNQRTPVEGTSSGHSRSNSGGGSRPKFEIGGLQVDMYSDEFLRGQKSELSLRTESPDNDSAFSDNVSMLSSESSASSGGVRGEGHSSSRSMSSQSSSMSLASSPTQVEQAARLKAEKIKIALEKMKEASIKKLFIKAFSADNSAKSLLIDERMTVGHVCKLLAEKNHVAMDPKWALVEQIPELYIERVYEDHEHVVENLLLWTRDSCNRLFFLERKDKYDLFMNPQNYLLGCSSSEKHLELDDDAKNCLLDEFFSTSNIGVPEVEGSLYLKSDGKKAWKKHFFVLRASGLYYCPKGKSKLSKDLLCLTTFDMNNVYLGHGWKKKYKSPTEFGFAIKHPQIQTKSSKYIKYLCAEDEKSLKQFMMGIRIAKYGLQLKENYEILLREIAEEDLENLANARSFSITSVAKSTAANSDITDSSGYNSQMSEKASDFDQLEDELPTTLERFHKLRVISRQDSIKSSKSNTSNSSGCPSERSSTGTPTTDHLVFDTDFPMGTIKRKPSMTPKIPLTSTTRNLAKQSGEEQLHLDGLSNGSGSGGSSCNGSLNGSLGRSTCGRFSLRRSKTDDRISFGSLSRRSPKQSIQDTPPSTLLREDLPLPPPPPEITNGTDCMSFDTLPPPPPEAFRTETLRLESLPPPPVPDENADVKWLTESNISALPPPLSLQNDTFTRSPDRKCKKSSPAVPPKPRKSVRRRQSESDAHGTPPRLSEHHSGLVVVKPKPSKHNLNLELSVYDGGEWTDASTPASPPCRRHNRTSCADNPKPRASSRSRRTSAPCVTPAQLQVHSIMSPSDEPSKPMASDRKSRSQLKPSPPKRSENTKLSSAFTAPQRRSASASAAPYDQEEYPPESFLRNLQKVMVKKWKVAQQLSTDNTATQHEILGFRDPNCLPVPEAGRPLQRSPSSPPPLPTHASKSHAPRSTSSSRSGAEISKAESKHSKKHPPPPPPKRAENKSPLW